MIIEASPYRPQATLIPSPCHSHMLLSTRDSHASQHEVSRSSEEVPSRVVWREAERSWKECYLSSFSCPKRCLGPRKTAELRVCRRSWFIVSEPTTVIRKPYQIMLQVVMRIIIPVNVQPSMRGQARKTLSKHRHPSLCPNLTKCH